jgi:hypothetical protein
MACELAGASLADAAITDCVQATGLGWRVLMTAFDPASVPMMMEQIQAWPANWQLQASPTQPLRIAFRPLASASLADAAITDCVQATGVYRVFIEIYAGNSEAQKYMYSINKQLYVCVCTQYRRVYTKVYGLYSFAIPDLLCCTVQNMRV